MGSTSYKSYNLTLLVVVLSAVLVSKPSFAAFVSIDCGASDPYTDENQITWAGDDGYVQSGESQQVDQLYTVGHVLSTLRVFPTSGNSNCYTIGGLQNGERVLVRATFFYGNYDGQNSPPTFDLYFDGNLWITMTLSNYTENTYVFTEAIYIVSGTATSICLAQTMPNQIPFISSLELRSLGPDMYSHVGAKYFLSCANRATFAKQSVRYPDDPYDRLWTNYAAGQSSEILTSDAAIDVSTSEDQPPQAVLQNAYATTSTSLGPMLDTKLPAGEGNVYVIMYFSEVTRLDSTQKRSIQIYIDNNPYLDPIIPPYGSVLEVSITNVVASPSTRFSVQATPDSTLPPLINAYEVYTILPYGRTGKEYGNGMSPPKVQTPAPPLKTPHSPPSKAPSEPVNSPPPVPDVETPPPPSKTPRSPPSKTPTSEPANSPPPVPVETPPPPPSKSRSPPSKTPTWEPANSPPPTPVEAPPPPSKTRSPLSKNPTSEPANSPPPAPVEAPPPPSKTRSPPSKTPTSEPGTPQPPPVETPPPPSKTSSPAIVTPPADPSETPPPPIQNETPFLSGNKKNIDKLSIISAAIIQILLLVPLLLS